MNDLISRQALCEYALNQKDKSITPNDIMRLPSAQPTMGQVFDDDCVSRQAAIDALDGEIEITGRTNAETVKGYVRLVKDRLERLPSVQPDTRSLEQIKWERDIAIQQLKDLGYSLGEKVRTDGDTISRQALMKEFSDFVRASNNSDFAQTPTWNDAVSLVGSMPSVQLDLSSYSDKLWRNAYERGKAESEAEIVRCKDCKWKQGAECVRFADVRPFPNDFCSRAERREE